MERKKIIIAVNQPHEFMELRKNLVASGYEVKLTDNGNSALSLCRKFLPHLIAADLNLQKIDGHHLIRELKAHSSTRHIPFILFSNHRSVEERLHSLELGVDDYIALPLEFEEIQARMEIILKEIELFEAIPKRAHKGFSGKLGDLNLIELLQTLGVGSKSAIVKIINEDKEGFIYFKDGEILDATLEDLGPKEALFRMFTWIDGTFSVDIKEVDHPREFEESAALLIAEGLTYLDRWEKSIKSLPPLKTVVKRAANLTSAQLSPEELSILNLMNGKTKINDLIENSNLNDLKAVQVISKLLNSKSLTALSRDEAEKLNQKDKNGTCEDNNSNRFSKIINTFLDSDNDKKRTPTSLVSGRSKRSGRKYNSSKLKDVPPEKNQIHLNKSELLMIKEKLMRNINRASDG